MEKKAVVLSGGGSRGAYQVGVWKALRKLHYRYKIVTGTSVGALNGTLMVQNDYFKCLKLWKNIAFDQLFIEKFPKNVNGIIGKTKVYRKYAFSFIKSGGINTSRFEELIYKLYNPFRFFYSNVDFGVVTYNVTSRKAIEITKNEMTESEVPLYIIASASPYPAFPMKKIAGENYVDGGYSDYIPIDLAIKMGATEIVAVDLNAVGKKRKVDTSGIDIKIISPKNQIASFLVFDKNLSRKAIKYGYNDTMKAFGKLEGNLFTFYLNELSNEYRKNSEKIKEALEKRLLPIEHSLLEQLLRLSVFHRLLEDKTGEKRKKFFDDIIELIGKSLKVDDTKIYHVKDFLKESLRNLSNVDVLNIKIIEEKIKIKKVRSLFGTSTIMRYLYDKIKTIPKNKKQRNDYSRCAILFPKEFIAVVYLIILNEEYEIIQLF